MPGLNLEHQTVFLGVAQWLVLGNRAPDLWTKDRFAVLLVLMVVSSSGTSAPYLISTVPDSFSTNLQN